MNHKLFIEAASKAYKTGDDKDLRNIPEGRAFLLEIAKERRKQPLWLRRAPKLLGEQAAGKINDYEHTKDV